MTTTTHPKITLAQVADYVAARKCFNCNGTLRGTYFADGNTGELPADRVTGFFRNIDSADDYFVVYSYQTPIAW